MLTYHHDVPACPQPEQDSAPTNINDSDPTLQTFSESIPDEDILEGAVTDPNILAEVNLPKKPSTL